MHGSLSFLLLVLLGNLGEESTASFLIQRGCTTVSYSVCSHPGGFLFGIFNSKLSKQPPPGVCLLQFSALRWIYAFSTSLRITGQS